MIVFAIIILLMELVIFRILDMRGKLHHEIPQGISVLGYIVASLVSIIIGTLYLALPDSSVKIVLLGGQLLILLVSIYVVVHDARKVWLLDDWLRRRELSRRTASKIEAE